MRPLMKSCIILLALFFTVGAYSQVALQDASSKMATSTELEKEIAMTDAPSAVQQAIMSDRFSGWEARKVLHIQKDGREYYKVKFKKGDEKVYHKFNPDGTLKMSKDKSKMKKDKSS